MIATGHICDDCGELIEGRGETLEQAQKQLCELVLVHEMVCDHSLLKNDMEYLNKQYEKSKATR